MPKFVKLSAVTLFSVAWWRQNAMKLFSKNNAVLKFLKIDKINPATFANKILEAMSDPQFQDLIFSTLISVLKDENGKPLDITPQEMFKDITYYFKTQGTQVPGKPSASIAEGAYQSVFRDISKIQALPRKTAIEDTFSELKKVAEAPNFKQKSISEKKKILSDFVKRIAGENPELNKMIDNSFNIKVQ